MWRERSSQSRAVWMRVRGQLDGSLDNYVLQAATTRMFVISKVTMGCYLISLGVQSHDHDTHDAAGDALSCPPWVLGIYAEWCRAICTSRVSPDDTALTPGVSMSCANVVPCRKVLNWNALTRRRSDKYRNNVYPSHDGGGIIQTPSQSKIQKIFRNLSRYMSPMCRVVVHTCGKHNMLSYHIASCRIGHAISSVLLFHVRDLQQLLHAMYVVLGSTSPPTQNMGWSKLRLQSKYNLGLNLVTYTANWTTAYSRFHAFHFLVVLYLILDVSTPTPILYPVVAIEWRLGLSWVAWPLPSPRLRVIQLPATCHVCNPTRGRAWG